MKKKEERDNKAVASYYHALLVNEIHSNAMPMYKLNNTSMASEIKEIDV